MEGTPKAAPGMSGTKPGGPGGPLRTAQPAAGGSVGGPPWKAASLSAAAYALLPGALVGGMPLSSEEDWRRTQSHGAQEPGH